MIRYRIPNIHNIGNLSIPAVGTERTFGSQRRGDELWDER